MQQNHYDAEGYHDSIIEQDKVTNFVYQGGMLLHELDEDKNPARHYVLGNEYIGLDHNYYLTDEQGSVRYVLDAAGNVQNDYQYDAFGQRIAGHENTPNRLRYNAQIEDDLTGLYYLRARYYNTGIGRFTQEDVIYNDGLNLYAYCSSNPVMYSDPSGFTKQCDPKVGGEKDSKSGGNSSITNDILECQRKGSALKVDEIKPITQINPKTRRPEIIKEFPATAQSHGFNDLIDNYAGYATKSLIRNGTLYQLKGTLNGVQGRFEWIIQDGYVTHRMFVRDGTMNGVPIKP